MRSIVGVGMTPPKVLGTPNPASSVMMSKTLGASLGGTMRGAHQALDERASFSIVPPNAGSGAGSLWPLTVVVAPGDPTVPVVSMAVPAGTAAAGAAGEAGGAAGVGLSALSTACRVEQPALTIALVASRPAIQDRGVCLCMSMFLSRRYREIGPSLSRPIRTRCQPTLTIATWRAVAAAAVRRAQARLTDLG